MLFERLAGRLIETAAAGGAVIVVDDIHWADEPSLVALLHVVRTVRRARLLVCVAERPGGSDSTDGWRGGRSSLMREPRAHLMELRGLSQAGSAELLHELLGGRVPEQLVSHAYAISAGNPFYLREVVRALDRAAASDVELPATLAGVVEQRLEQLTPRTRELLRASSILGEEFSIAIGCWGGRCSDVCRTSTKRFPQVFCQQFRATGCGSRTPSFVRPWSPGCRCENRSGCTAGRCGQSSSSTPIPCLAISPT